MKKSNRAKDEFWEDVTDILEAIGVIITLVGIGILIGLLIGK